MIHAFGAFELDTEALELRKSGLRRHVPPQVFRVLVHLVESEGRVVTRSELRSLIWGECSVVEFDQGLNFAIHRIRVVLDDSARSPRFVETLPKIGYRFLAPVFHLEPTAPAPTISLPPPATEKPKDRRPAWFLIAACCLFDLGHAATRERTPPHVATSARAAMERGLASAAEGISGKRRSIPHFREAVRLDPRLAEAHYAMAQTYLDLARQGGLEPRPALVEARQAADRAIHIEDRATSRLARGWIRLHLDRDLAGAAADFERARALEPGNAGVLAVIANFHSLAGSSVSALELVARAEVLSPSCDLVAHDAANVLYRSRRFEEAIERFGRAEELGTPRGVSRVEWQARNREGAMWARLALSSDATPEIARFLETRGVTPAQIARWRSTGPDRTRRFLESSIERLEGQPGSTYSLIRLHALLGHVDEAMRLLSGIAARKSFDVLELLASPALDSLKADASFLALRSTFFAPRLGLESAGVFSRPGPLDRAARIPRLSPPGPDTLRFPETAAVGREAPGHGLGEPGESREVVRPATVRPDDAARP